MKKFNLEDLNIQKADVSNLNGGVCKCCIIVPPNGVAAFGAAAGCDSERSRKPKEIENNQ